MPKICLDCRYIKPVPSGIAGVVEALVEHLPQLAPDWHFTFLRHASLGRHLSDAKNVSEIELADEPNGPSALLGLPKSLNLDQFDLFHAPSNILPRGIKIPSITTIHDIMWLTHPALCNRSLWGKVERAFYTSGIKRALDYSETILTVSDATRRAIINYNPQFEPKVRTAISGVSDHFQPFDVLHADLANYGLQPREFVLTVGQSAPYKNHEGALRAFAAAFGHKPTIKMVFVQRRGNGIIALKRLAKQLGVSDQVVFLSQVQQADLARLYCSAAVLLHPSFIEGFGMPVAEAMASGCPVITSDQSAMPEVTGGAALLIDAEDTASIAKALQQVFDEPGLADALSQKGLRRAKQLNWRNFARGNLAAYRRVLGLDATSRESL